jgi:hypothetical protein
MTRHTTRIVDEPQVCCTGLPVTRLRDHRRRRIGTYHVAARCCVLRQRRSGAAADIKDGPPRMRWAQPVGCCAKWPIERLDDEVIEPRLDRKASVTAITSVDIVHPVCRITGRAGAPAARVSPDRRTTSRRHLVAQLPEDGAAH